MTDNPNPPLLLTAHRSAALQGVYDAASMNPAELVEQINFLLSEIVEVRQQLAVLLEEKEQREQEQQDHGSAL